MRRVPTVWDEMRRMQESMDLLFRDFFSSEPASSPHFMIGDTGQKGELIQNKFMAPASDVYETEKDVVAEIDLPGIDKKDINVNITDDFIEVKAEKSRENKQQNKKEGMYRFERTSEGFYRKFALPSPVDADKAQAECKDGVLKITVPKKQIEHKKSKQLQIK